MLPNFDKKNHWKLTFFWSIYRKGAKKNNKKSPTYHSIPPPLQKKNRDRERGEGDNNKKNTFAYISYCFTNGKRKIRNQSV